MLKSLLCRTGNSQPKLFLKRNFSNKEPYQGGERNFWQSGNGPTAPKEVDSGYLKTALKFVGVLSLTFILLPFPHAYTLLKYPDVFNKKIHADLAKYRVNQDLAATKNGRPKMTDAQFKSFSDAAISVYNPYITTLKFFGVTENKVLLTKNVWGDSDETVNFESQSIDFPSTDFPSYEPDFGSDSFGNQSDEQFQKEEDAHNKRW